MLEGMVKIFAINISCDNFSKIIEINDKLYIKLPTLHSNDDAATMNFFVKKKIVGISCPVLRRLAYSVISSLLKRCCLEYYLIRV